MTQPPGPPPYAPPPPPPLPRRPARRPPASGRSPATVVGVLLIVASLATIAVVAFRLASRPSEPPPVAQATASPTTPGASPTPGASESLSVDASGDPGADPSPSPTPTPRPGAGGIATPAPTKAPSSGRVKLPKITADVAGATTVRTFAIAGDTPDKLVRQMLRKAKQWCTSDAVACTHLSVDPRIRIRIDPSTAACTMTGAAPRITSTVYLPRWAKPAQVPRRLPGWWREVLDHIAWHEGRHITIERQWTKKLPGLVEGKPCSRAAAVLKSWATKVAKAQAAFDANELATYRLPEYTGPGGYFGPAP